MIMKDYPLIRRKSFMIMALAASDRPNRGVMFGLRAAATRRAPRLPGDVAFTAIAKRTGAVGQVKLTPRPGAADANEGRRAGGETLPANPPAAHIAYFVYAGINFPQGRVNRREMPPGLRNESRYVLPFESDRRALRVMFVVPPGRTLARTGDNRGELPLQLRYPAQRLVAIGGQSRLGGTRVSHLRHLPLK
jgi:hypothetical protein